MAKQLLTLFLIGLILGALVFEQADALLKLKKLAKIGLLAKALKGKRIIFPLPLPLPIPLFKENVHHAPYPVNHHTQAVVGYGYQHGHHGGHHGGGWW